MLLYTSRVSCWYTCQHSGRRFCCTKNTDPAVEERQLRTFGYSLS